MKTCPKCQTIKSIDMFPKDPNRKSGLHPYCKMCRNEEQKERERKKFNKRWNASTRKCATCGNIKSLEEFRDPSTKNKFVKVCNICKQQTQLNYERPDGSEFYNKNKTRILQKASNNRRAAKEMYVKQLGGECQECHIALTDNNVCIFDFHHIGEKDTEISKLLKSVRSNTEKISSELKKCVLLCANCHRMTHQKKKEQ